jgi:hypothetical protein
MAVYDQIKKQFFPEFVKERLRISFKGKSFIEDDSNRIKNSALQLLKNL